MQESKALVSEFHRCVLLIETYVVSDLHAVGLHGHVRSHNK